VQLTSLTTLLNCHDTEKLTKWKLQARGEIGDRAPRVDAYQLEVGGPLELVEHGVDRELNKLGLQLKHLRGVGGRLLKEVKVIELHLSLGVLGKVSGKFIREALYLLFGLGMSLDYEND
jgi:hypothetical protein